MPAGWLHKDKPELRVGRHMRVSDDVHGGDMVRHADTSMEGGVEAISRSRRRRVLREKKGWAMGKDA